MIQIMKNKTFILIIFLCFLPLFCKGQFCKLYSTHGDISSSMISHIYQDAKGYIWVATENGLNKYDGAKFTNYKNQFNDSTSLLGNHVYRTFQDAKGHLYILSTKGLQMYEYKSDSFKTIKKSNSSYNNKSIAQKFTYDNSHYRHQEILRTTTTMLHYNTIYEQQTYY